MSDFSIKLETLIKYRNKSQKELSEELMMTPSTLNGYVRGTRQPDLDTIKKICNILNASVSYFFSLDGPYIHENRNLANLFDEMGDVEHESLLKTLNLPPIILMAYHCGELSFLYDLEMANKIANVFNVSVEYILGQDEQGIYEPTETQVQKKSEDWKKEKNIPQEIPKEYESLYLELYQRLSKKERADKIAKLSPENKDILFKTIDSLIDAFNK